MVDARHAAEAAEEAKRTALSVVASGVAAGQAVAFREAFDGPTRVLPPLRVMPKLERGGRGQSGNEKSPDDETNREGRGQCGGESASSGA